MARLTGLESSNIFYILFIFFLLVHIKCRAQVKFDYREAIKKYQIECLDVANVDPVQVIHVRAGWWKRRPTIALQKWALCILNKSGVMSEEGVFKLDEAINNVEPEFQEQVTAEVEKCLPQKKMAPYEIAWSYLKCYNYKHPKNFNVL